MAAAGFLALAVFFYFYQVLTSDLVFCFRDLSRYYYPLRQFAVGQVKIGSFPFWNPYVGSGHPLYAAVQSVVLYPLSAIYYLFDLDTAFNYFLVGHVFLGGLFFFLMMRSFGYGRAASLISGLSFMLGGYLISVVNLSTTLGSVIWVPLVLLFLDRLLKRRSWGDCLLTALSLVLLFLGGNPDYFYPTVCLMALYALWQADWRRPLAWRRLAGPVLTTFGAVLAAVLLLSFQLLPFAELIGISTRSSSTFDTATYWSLHPYNFVNFFIPFFYGTLDMQKETPVRQDWLLVSYLGIVPLVLAGLAFFQARGRRASFFKWAFWLGLVLALGRFTPFYKVLYDHLPGFGLIRYPIKFFFICAVSFAFLAGAGWQSYLDALARRPETDRRFDRLIKAVFLAGFVLALVFLFQSVFQRPLLDWLSQYIRRHFVQDEYKHLLLFNADLYNIKRLIWLVILSSLVLFVGYKKNISRIILGLVMILLVWFDLTGSANLDINPALPRTVLHRTTPNIDYLQKDKDLFRIFTSPQANKENDVIRGSDYEQAMLASKDQLANNRLIEYGVYDSRGYFSIHNRDYIKVMSLIDTAPQPSSTNLLNMLNVKYVLTLKPLTDPRCRLVNRGYNTYLYQNLDCLPRAYLAPKYRVLKNEKEISDRLKSKDFRPDREVILTEEPRSGGSVQTQLPARQDGNPDLLSIIKYEPNRVVIEATSSRPGFLVLADNYYPGWTAYLDGKKTKLYRANYVLRAVYLDRPGRHLVEFRYIPRSFYLGLLISSITLLALSFLIVRQKDRQVEKAPSGIYN